MEIKKKSKLPDSDRQQTFLVQVNIVALVPKKERSKNTNQRALPFFEQLIQSCQMSP